MKSKSENHAAIAAVTAAIDMEPYMPVMTPSQLRRFEKAIINQTMPDFTPTELADLERRLNNKQDEINARFAAAQRQSTHTCRTTKAKK